MTMEGAAIVHSMGRKVTWPKHHSVPPAAIYTISAEDVWTQAEKPNLVYDSNGTRIHEANLIDMTRVRNELVDPNDIIGKMPADESILPKAYNDKWTSVYVSQPDQPGGERRVGTLAGKDMFHDPVN